MHILEGLSRLTDGPAPSFAEQTLYGYAPPSEAAEHTERLIAKLQHEHREEERAQRHELWLRRQPDCPPWRRL